MGLHHVIRGVHRVAASGGGTLAHVLPWMAWNAALALIPLVLAEILFRNRRARLGAAWWVGAIVALLFLPNTLYTLTDLIHLPGDVNHVSPWLTAFVLVPAYGIYCLIGVLSYVVSVIWFGRMLRRRGASRRGVRMAETALAAVTAFGIFLGRFVRLNSWDAVHRPRATLDAIHASLVDPHALAFSLVFFIATCVLYWPVKYVVVATVVFKRSGGSADADRMIEQHM